MNLKEKAKKLPSSPGVYLMQDSSGNIIYVGKAKNLTNRVRSYFLNSQAKTQKIERLKKNIEDFEIILTDTEFEAFMLECKLIKELKPFYNRKMKNPQTYTYIVIQMNNGFHGIQIIHSPIYNDNSISFGPYSSKSTVNRAIQGIKEHYKINCSYPAKRNTPCLNYSLGLCLGMCLGGTAVKQYHNVLSKLTALLNGTNTEVIDDLKEKMISAAEKLDFETAAKYRGYSEAVQYLLNRENLIEFTEANKNILVLESLPDSNLKLFLIKGNKVLFSEKYNFRNTDFKQVRSAIKTKLLTHFHTTENSPIVISKDDIDEAQIIYSYLKGSNCSYEIIPEKWLKPRNNSEIDEALSKLLGNQS